MAKTFRELPSYPMGGDFLGMPQVRSTLRQHEIGDFRMSSNLVDMMQRDDRLVGLTRTRIQGLLGLDVEFEPHGDGRSKAKVADEAKESWQAMFPEAQLYSWLFWGIYIGIGVAQNVVDTKSIPGRWLPRMRVWHPMNLRWDDGSKRYMMGTQDGEIPIEQDDPEWCLYMPYGYERGWMSGLVRSAATSWLVRQWSYRDWARYSEVHGQPIKLAITPQAGDNEDKERWARQVADLGAETTLRTTDGGDGNKFDLQFREPTGDSHQCFRELMDAANTNLSILLTGHNLTSEVKQGSLAAARVGADIKAELKAFDAKTAGAALRDGALKRWAKWNFGDAELAPMPKWQIDPPADLKAAADTLVSFGAAVTGLRDAGVNPDVKALCEEFTIPSLGPKTDDEQEAADKEKSDRALQLVNANKPDEPTDEAAGEPETGDGEDAPPKDKRMAASATAGDTVKASKSSRQLAKAVKSQSYIDALAEDATKAGRAALAVDLKDILQHIEAAKDPDDLKKRLITAYGAMDSERLTEVVERAMIISELKGAASALDEL